MAQNEKWYEKIWLWLVAIVAGILAFVRLRRTNVSGQSGKGIERLGNDLKQVGNSVKGTSESISAVTESVSNVDDTAQRIADTSKQLSSTTERVAELHSEATNSVGRIRELIKAERQRLAELNNKE